jgi:diguanylate cyclase (GGDEF)-like protein
MTDVDHFKRVNDQQGHLAGDEVLREVVRRISNQVRVYDCVGRYGGEEFLVILPNCNESMALGVAERLRAVLAATPISALGRSLAVTSSFGVACQELGESIEMLVARADAALYRAKHRGRNRVEAASAQRSDAADVA